MGGTILVICILLLIVVGAVISSAKHFKGEGGCCGGGSVKVKGDKIKNVVAVKTIYIEGMHCSSCSSRVQNALNSMDQVNAKVDLKKQQAAVKLGRNVSDEELKRCVERCGYTVRSIE